MSWLRSKLTLRNVALLLLLAWGTHMTLRSIILQRRLERLEFYTVKMHVDYDQKISGALEIASNALHEASNKKITPPQKSKGHHQP